MYKTQRKSGPSGHTGGWNERPLRPADETRRVRKVKWTKYAAEQEESGKRMRG